MLTSVETQCLAAFRAGAGVPVVADPHDAWIAFGLYGLLEASHMLRAALAADARGAVVEKHDGSPATAVEHQVELRLRERLAAFQPQATMVGEETGGDLPATGWAIAVDPVDGTWAFLTGTETYSSTLAVFRDGVPLFGFVANPTTGTIAYGAAAGASRLLRVALVGEADAACDLPEATAPGDKVLVNLHPSVDGAWAFAALHAAWKARQVRSVRSPGGSPAWAIVEAARGRYVYANVWSTKPAEPFDLAAAAVILRGAGGDVVGLDGQAVDVCSHAGPFVAGLRQAARQPVVELLRDARRLIPPP